MIKLVLPSLTEIIIVIILIIPGFIFSWLFRRITAIGGKFSEFEITIWSLISTLPIYIIFSLITGIQNIETLEENIFSPSYLFLLSSLPVLLGLFLGFIIKKTIRKEFVYGDCWHGSLNKLISRGGYLIVITKDGKEYIGKLHSFGEDDTKELVLRDPEQIIRNKKMKVISKFKVGREILFLKNDISRILFFNEINLP